MKSDRIVQADAFYNWETVQSQQIPVTRNLSLYFLASLCAWDSIILAVSPPKLLSRLYLWLLYLLDYCPSGQNPAGHCRCHRCINNPTVNVTYLSSSSHLIHSAFFSSVFGFLIWAPFPWRFWQLLRFLINLESERTCERASRQVEGREKENLKQTWH